MRILADVLSMPVGRVKYALLNSANGFFLAVCLSACSSPKEQQADMHFIDDVILPHTSIRNQGRTQTCWAYSMTSLYESEYMETSGDSLQLSVMYAVRQKYMRQFEHYYYSKGYDEIRGGSLGHSYLQVFKESGAVPYDVYTGHQPDAKFHDHRTLLKELRSLGDEAVKRKNLPDYQLKAEQLLDEYLGKVPDSFTYNGLEYTPVSFAKSLGLSPEQYVQLTSFTHHPFHSWFVLEVPDNWEHAPFYNLPIDSLETCVKSALSDGRTVVWDGDISENGFLSRSGVAFYPQSPVTQSMRQEEFEKFRTTDDHMMHIVGTAHDENGKFYYVLKNSWGRRGAKQGYIYMSDDYFRAKTVSVVIRKKDVSSFE